jgi:hypothetical protein
MGSHAKITYAIIECSPACTRVLILRSESEPTKQDIANTYKFTGISNSAIV